MRKALLILVLALLTVFPAGGQNHIRRAMQHAREQREAMARRQVSNENPYTGGGGYLRMKVENGDTTYLDSIDPIWIFGHTRKNEKEWRKYYKTVWRFAKVYPYALAAGKLQEQVDSVFALDKMNRIRKERYISGVQEELFQDFGGALKDMSIAQGALLLKLIDRETGKSSYSIIKEYKNGVAAGFWNGIAHFFDNDLHAQFDPEGEDADLEQLCRMWEAGTFRDLYRSIFWEEPPVVKVPDKYK